MTAQSNETLKVQPDRIHDTLALIGVANLLSQIVDANGVPSGHVAYLSKGAMSAAAQDALDGLEPIIERHRNALRSHS